MDRESSNQLRRPQVLITRPIQQSVIEKISEHCDVQVHSVDEPMPAELLAAAMRDKDGVMPAGVRISKDIIDAAPRLRGRQCATTFRERWASEPDFSRKARQLCQELSSGSWPVAVSLWHECFALAGLDSPRAFGIPRAKPGQA